MPRRPLLALAAALALSGCAGTGPKDGKPEVVATTTQLADVARNVAGARADVTQLLQPNTDAHDYEPRPNDVLAVARAALFLTSGDGLDRWAKDLVEEGGADEPVVDLSEGLPVQRPGQEGETYDPHWWHDPRNVEAATLRIRDALSRADPAGRAAYGRNAAAYVAKLRALDAGIARCFAAVPARERRLVTDHDAFGYFAARYDIRVVGAVIPSQTTGAQSSARDLARLARVVKREGVKAIFPETSLNQDLAKAVARAAGITAEDELYGDSLGPKGSAGATYLGMEAANADAMVRGFTGGRQRCRLPV